MPPFIQALFNMVLGKLAPAAEMLFADYQTYEAGGPVTTPSVYETLSNGSVLAAKATIRKITHADPIDLNPEYLAGEIAKQAPDFFAGKIISLEPFTVPLEGEFAEVTLQIQLQGGAQTGQEPGTIAHVAQPDGPKLPDVADAHEVPPGKTAPNPQQAALDKQFPK